VGVLKQNEEITAETKKITVTVQGGFDPNNKTMRLHVIGSPQFIPGEQVLLFLVKHKGVYVVHHFALGAFHQVEDTQGTNFATRGIDDRHEGQARHLGLFKEWIRSVLSNYSNTEKSRFNGIAISPLQIISRYDLDSHSIALPEE
jgi:hypothetical protein